MSQKIINILKETGAFLEGHFLLSSGKHSGGYVQCAKVLRFPDKAEKVLKPVVEQLKNVKIDKVIGPAMGGVVVSYEVGRQLGKESLFTERKDGVMELRRGFEIVPGDKVIIAEDVVTTGKSTIETKEALEKLGAEVIGVACIVKRVKEDIGMPIYCAVDLNIEVYDSEDCPICSTGQELVKPGSRDMKK
ncbi:orotate phosphoribosyltransferase [Alkalibaculum bacchi]|uniref:orotate phosphoribosyltransferase n=1 Tax=Alkalibaculum bacchi TaxID=645887 RepID=UPI0026F0DB0E|nr:orotate phosphoribosyltransferase [Alkalibaculum bacchi]